MHGELKRVHEEIEALRVSELRRIASAGGYGKEGMLTVMNRYRQILSWIDEHPPEGTTVGIRVICDRVGRPFAIQYLESSYAETGGFRMEIQMQDDGDR